MIVAIEWLIIASIVSVTMSVLLTAGFFRLWVHAWFGGSVVVALVRWLSVIEYLPHPDWWVVVIWANLCAASALMFGWLARRVAARLRGSGNTAA